MIVGIGCDVVNHQISEKLGWTSDKSTIHRIFTNSEISQYNTKNKISFLCGRFAVKEAVVKCLGTGFQDGITTKNIETINLKCGRPSIKLYGEALLISQKLGIKRWFVSISHSADVSIAYVCAEQ